VVGLGSQELLGWLRRRGRNVWVAAMAVLLAGVAAETAYFGKRFFVDGVHDRTTQIEYQAALLDAARWLKPRIGPGDPAVCTTTGRNEPFVVMLVGLGYDPRQWLRDEKDRLEGDFDRYRRFGRFSFIYDDAAQARVKELQADTLQ